MDASPAKPSSRAWLALRWLLVPAAVWIAGYAGLVFQLTLPWGDGRAWGEVVGCFAIAAIVVVAAGLTAPRGRILVAAAVAVAVWTLRQRLPGFEDDALGVFLGALSGTAFVSAVVLLRRRRLASVGAFAASLAAAIICSQIADARLAAADAAQDEVPYYIREVLGERATEVKRAYVYDTSIMMNTFEVCRLDASAELIMLLVDGLRLKRLDQMPPEFWCESPSYWPRELPTGAECFGRTSDFDPECIHDHETLLLLHDRAAERAYISFTASL